MKIQRSSGSTQRSTLHARIFSLLYLTDGRMPLMRAIGSWSEVTPRPSNVGFKGPNPKVAARRAHKAWQLQKDDNGQWRDIQVVTPTGGTSRIYINKDKNPK
eukprot:11769072-Karenia_brevis.AAC.1